MIKVGSLKDLCDELFTHVSDNPSDVAAFDLCLIKRPDDEDANRKALDKFMNTVRELGITISNGPVDLPEHYVFSIKTTLKALATLAEINHDLEDMVPYQMININ